MAELLIKNKSNSHPDPDKDLAGSWKKGQIVGITEDGAVWRPTLFPITFVLLKVPGVVASVFSKHLESFHRFMAFNVDATNATTDTATITASVTNRTAIRKLGGLKLRHVMGFLDHLGATNISVANGAVTFDISVADFVKAPAQWPAPGLIITELAYRQAGGEHDFKVDHSVITNVPVAKKTAMLEKFITDHNGTVIGNDATSVSFTYTRAEARARIQAALKDAAESEVVVQRRFYLKPAAVDAIVAAGGIMTATKAQLLNNLVNVADT